MVARLARLGHSFGCSTLVWIRTPDGNALLLLDLMTFAYLQAPLSTMYVGVMDTNVLANPPPHSPGKATNTDPLGLIYGREKICRSWWASQTGNPAAAATSP